MKFGVDVVFGVAVESPSTRREWIEINTPIHTSAYTQSPSTRREWIEIAHGTGLLDGVAQSPSTRREWIEIHFQNNLLLTY